MVAMANKMCKVVLCVCVSIVWLGGAAAEIGRRKNNITRSMLQEVVEVMGREPVRYTEPNETVLTAAIQFDMRAMGLIYKTTQPVINIIANKQAYPEGIVNVSKWYFKVKPPEQLWQPLLMHYAGLSVVGAVVALAIALLPLTGLVWCCWQCCCMGRREPPFDDDERLKGILYIILVLLALFLLGVVCAFTADSHVEAGAMEATNTIRVAINYMRAYLNQMQSIINYALKFNSNEVETSLKAQLRSVGMTEPWKLAISRVASVTTLNRMVQNLDAVKRKLRTVKFLTAVLRLKAEKLNTGLRKVKNQLLQTLAKCDQLQCRVLQQKYKIDQLDTEIQYSQMPDVSELLNNVTQLLDSDIKSEVAQGQKAFSDIQRGIQRSIRRSIDLRMPDVSGFIGGLGAQLSSLTGEVTAVMQRASAVLAQQEARLAYADEMRARFGPVRRLIALGAASALLLVVLLLVSGVLCGACCRGIGAKTLYCGIIVIFLLGSAVLAVMLGHLIAGVLVTRFVCDPLTEPRGKRLVADVEKMVDIEYTLYRERKDPTFTLTSILERCHANNTLYKTLHMWRFFNLLGVRSSLRSNLETRLPAPDPLLPRVLQPVVILHASARRKLQQLAATDLTGYDIDRILSTLETNMTSLALDQLVQQLNSTARSLQQPLFAAEAASLLQASAALCELQDAVLRPMLEHSARLNSTALELQDDLRFNHSSLKEAIAFLVHEISEGEASLNDMRRFSWDDLGDVGQQVWQLPGNLTNMIPGNLTNVIPGDVTNMIPGNLTNMIPGDLTNMIPGNLTNMIPGDLTNMIPGDLTNLIPGGLTNLIPTVNLTNIMDTLTNMIPGNLTNIMDDLTSWIPSNLTGIVGDLTNKVTDLVGTQLGSYMQQVLSALEQTLEQSLGHCGPLSSIFNGTRDAICHRILMPVNGYWMSLAWCALLAPALLLVSRRLARLYTPYPGTQQGRGGKAGKCRAICSGAYDTPKAEKAGEKAGDKAGGECRAPCSEAYNAPKGDKAEKREAEGAYNAPRGDKAEKRVIGGVYYAPRGDKAEKRDDGSECHALCSAAFHARR